MVGRQRASGGVWLVSKVTSNRNTTSSLRNLAHPKEGCRSPDKSVAVISYLSPRQYVPTSFLSFPAHLLDDPNVFLWFYEGLAVAYTQMEDKAGKEQASSDCSPQATMQNEQKSVLIFLYLIIGLDS